MEVGSVRMRNEDVSYFDYFNWLCASGLHFGSEESKRKLKNYLINLIP